MYKNNIPEAPELGQIAKFASFLDSIGEHADAQILDEYIEKAATYNEFEILKQAGLWGNIWKRLKGSVKKMFISEYRDLYDEAKKSQDKLEERISKIKEESKNIKENFKNYDFGEWKSNISKLQMQGLYTSDIMQGFDAKYAKFVNYVTDHFKEEGKEISPEFQAMVDKMKVNEKEENAVGNMFKGWDKEKTSWVKSDGVNKSIQVFINDPDKIRILKSFYDNWTSIERQHIIGVSNEPGIVSFNFKFKEKSKRPKNLESAFGNGKWKVLGTDAEYVYLEKSGILSGDEKAEAPPKVEEIKQEDVPKDIKPKLAPVSEEEKVEEKSQIPDLSKEPIHMISPPPKSEKSDVEKLMEEIEKPEPLSKRDPIVEYKKSPKVKETIKPEVPSAEVLKQELVPEEMAKKDPLQEKEIQEAELLSSKETQPITGKPEGTVWVRYKDGRFSPILQEKVDLKRHELVTDPSSMSKLDAMWAKRENSKKSQIKESFDKRNNKIISISPQLDMSARKQRISELLKK